MIIDIKSWTRAGKTLFGIYTAKYITQDRTNILDLERYHINQGYGNLTIHGLPYPYQRLDSRSLALLLFKNLDKGRENVLYFIDEAHRIFNPRLWKYWTGKQTYEMSGIYQDEKLDNIIILTTHAGSEKDELLGVDKIIRSNIGMLLEITSRRTHIELLDLIQVKYTDLSENKYDEPIEFILSGVSSYFSDFITKEPIH